VEVSPKNGFRDAKIYVMLLKWLLHFAFGFAGSAQRHRPIVRGNPRDSGIRKCTYQTHQQQ